MEQVVQLNLATPSLLFSAISLILLAYTNRFLAYASVIRNLNNEEKTATDAQISNLLKRIKLVRAMQMLGVLSLLSSLTAMFLLYIRQDMLGHIIFGIGMLLLGISLVICVWEIWISTQAIKTHLYQIERRSRSNHKGVERQQPYADKGRGTQKPVGNGSTPANTPRQQQQDKPQQGTQRTQQPNKGQDKPQQAQPQVGKAQSNGKPQEKSQEREQSNGKSQQPQERQAQQTTRAQRSQERLESKAPAIVPKPTTTLPATITPAPRRERPVPPQTEASPASTEEPSRQESSRPHAEETEQASATRPGRKNIRTPRSEEVAPAPTSSESESSELHTQPRGERTQTRGEQRYERPAGGRETTTELSSAPAHEEPRPATSSISEDQQERPTRAEVVAQEAPEATPEHKPTPRLEQQRRAPREQIVTETPTSREPRPTSIVTPEASTSEKPIREPQVDTPTAEVSVERPKASTERIETTDEPSTSSPRQATRNVNPARARLPRIPQRPRPAAPVSPETSGEAPNRPFSTTPSPLEAPEQPSREPNASED